MEMLPDEKIMCHETGFEKSCRDMVINSRCRKWRQIQGTNPNTGEPLNQWDCVDGWMPFLTLENTQQVRQVGAAVESFRNEAARTSQVQTALIMNAARPHLDRSREIDVIPDQFGPHQLGR